MLIRDTEIERYSIYYSQPGISVAACFLTVSPILTPSGLPFKILPATPASMGFSCSLDGWQTAVIRELCTLVPLRQHETAVGPSQGFGVGPAETRRIRFLRVRATRAG